MLLFFLFFFLSGFCSLVYQVVWLRAAMADFGVTTALVSIVVSVFMAGLALGSWIGGKLASGVEKRSAGFLLSLYGVTELLIGVSGIAVVPLLKYGRAVLANFENGAWGSSLYYLASAACVAIVMLPFCTCMGATFPLAMASIRAALREYSEASFSYLYLANVLGAAAGALASAFVFIELFGFSKTLLIASALNALIAALAFTVARGNFGARAISNRTESTANIFVGPKPDFQDGRILAFLFASGLSSLGMEIVWTRQFVPFVGPVVYSFATIVVVYLLATAIGSRAYRLHLRRELSQGGRVRWEYLAILSSCCALFPLVTADPRLPVPHLFFRGAWRILFGVAPFCAVLGFITPMLMDRWSAGVPDRAGRGYAINTIGCIIGPLLAGFVLLPAMGERWTLVLLALPLLVLSLLPAPRKIKDKVGAPRSGTGAWSAAAAVSAALIIVFVTRDYETLFPHALVRRDHTATVIAEGEGMDKRLLVNGVGITSLTPNTKMMAHLPLAVLESKPHKVLVICFGMGTSFRSALSWGVPVTVVELVPSVPLLFGYFHRDADQLLKSPDATVVIDDGRRFLERTGEKFDAIVIDPPPPVESAGSSMLYSREFYAVAARHLTDNGILQQWLPEAGPTVTAAFAQALYRSFPAVRVFRSIRGGGLHFLASSQPTSRRTVEELAARIPPLAARDLLEWGPFTTVDDQLRVVVQGEIPLESLMALDTNAPTLTDDRPVNEYYFLRTHFGALFHMPVARTNKPTNSTTRIATTIASSKNDRAW